MLEDVLKKYGGFEVDAMTVYKDMFKLGEGYIQKDGEPGGNFKANPIAYYKNKSEKDGHYRIMFEDTFEDLLEELQSADFAILNGISYFGKKNVQAHASKMFGMIFDLDGVTDSTLNAFLSGASTNEFDIYPYPNYIALSGHGVHLYYIFEEPIPLYPNIKLQLKNFKYALTDKIWNNYTSKEEKKQFQGINQGFRPIGGKSKIDGVRVRAFSLNQHPFSLDQMCKYVLEEYRVDESKLYRESTMTLEEAKKKYPQWYQDRVVDKLPKRYWTVKADLYNWWKEQIRLGATVHHRYFNIMCLAIYGVKCGIPFEQVEADALNLVPFMNLIAPDNEFTDEDAYSALECYDKRYCTFPIEDISKLSAIPIKRNKRNGQKQRDHLEEIRAIRDIRQKRQGTKWTDGNGRKPKRAEVEKWQAEHPNGKKSECHKETGISRPTIDKYWKIIG